MQLVSCTRAELLCINCSARRGPGLLYSLVSNRHGLHRQLRLKMCWFLGGHPWAGACLWVKSYSGTREMFLCGSLSVIYTYTPFNKMLAAREFCSQPGMWVFIRTDFLFCIRVRLQLPAFSLLHLAVTELQHVSQPFFFFFLFHSVGCARTSGSCSEHAV